jgi:hypothetical protein
MSFSDFNIPPGEDKNEPKPDANKQPSFEPKRVIHRSKPVPHAGDGNRRPASIFRPLYCSFDKNAQYPQGIYVCEDHDAPTSTPGVP